VARVDIGYRGPHFGLRGGAVFRRASMRRIHRIYRVGLFATDCAACVADPPASRGSLRAGRRLLLALGTVYYGTTSSAWRRGEDYPRRVVCSTAAAMSRGEPGAWTVLLLRDESGGADQGTDDFAALGVLVPVPPGAERPDKHETAPAFV
jgi:hypothetical protein